MIYVNNFNFIISLFHDQHSLIFIRYCHKKYSDTGGKMEKEKNGAYNIAAEGTVLMEFLFGV